MDRSQIVSQTIRTFNELRSQAAEIFSEDSILDHTEVMIEEFFEAKFNPYLRKLMGVIVSLPVNDYTVIALDLWIKDIGNQISIIENGPRETDYPEVVYLKGKYLPKLVSSLAEIKLELLEQLFSTEDNTEHNENLRKPYLEQDTVLSANEAGFLLSQMINFRIIRTDISPSTASKVMGPLMGIDPCIIEKSIVFDKTNHRYTASISTDELILLSKVIKSILARIENQIKTRNEG
jgi:hypothetical protein